MLLAIIGFFFVAFDRRPHWTLIKLWAAPFGLKVIYHSRYTDRFECDLDDKTLYVSRYNKAYHDKDEYVASIAHELGHLIGSILDENYPEKRQISRRLTKRATYLDETRAWKIAECLLQEGNIYNEEAFAALRDRCLLEYKKVLYDK